MKRTHSSITSRDRSPTTLSNQRLHTETNGQNTNAIDNFAHSPLPPFSPGIDFEQNEILLNFARNGVLALIPQDQNEHEHQDNLRQINSFCVKKNQLQVMVWTMIKTGSREIDLSRMHLKQEHLEILLTWSRTIPFKISLNFKFTRLDDLADCLFKGLHDNANIEGLNLEFCYRCEYGIPGDIRVSKNRIRDQSNLYKKLSTTLVTCTSLTEIKLTLDRNNIGNLGALLKHSLSLKKLNIQTFDQDNSDQGITEFADALATSTSLAELSFFNFPITAQSARKLSDALNKNHQISSLSLIYCDIEKDAARIFSEAISSNPHLKKLHLPRNRIEDEGAVAIAAALAINTSLTDLNLSENGIYDEGGTAIDSALATNSGLESLDLSHNQLHSNSYSYIDRDKNVFKGLQQNRTLRSLNLDCTMIISQYAVDILISALSSHPCLQSLSIDESYLPLSSKVKLLQVLESRPGLNVKLPLNQWRYPQAMMIDKLKAAIADETPIKQEPVLRQVYQPLHSTSIEIVDTTRSRHLSTSRFVMFDLTSEKNTIEECSVVLQNEVMIFGQQVYDSALEKVFPIRDPRNASHVHQEYADSDNPRACAKAVQLRGISFFKKSKLPVNESTLWDFLCVGFPDHKFENKNVFIESVKSSIKQEIDMVLQGEAPPSTSKVSIVRVNAGQCDSEEEAKALEGQYGAILKDYSAKAQPSLGNGQVICLFAGARLSSADDEQQYESSYPGTAVHDYGANAQKFNGTKATTWTPYGGGNMAQYFNSTFKPSEDGLQRVDQENTNSIIFPVRLDLTDKHGNERSESMLCLIQIAPVKEGKQLKLDYGSNYTLPG